MQYLAVEKVLDRFIQRGLRWFHGDSTVILNSGIYFDTFAGHITATIQAHSADHGALLAAETADLFDQLTEYWLLANRKKNVESKLISEYSMVLKLLI